LLGENVHLAQAAEMAHGCFQMEQRATAAHGQFAVLRVHDAAGAAAVGIEFQVIVAGMKLPRLRIVAGRREYSVTEEEFPFLGRRSTGREVFG
jgi:hypothetical protein